MIEEQETEAPSASGILGCLRLLAEEAASLGLHGTGAAIEEALSVATQEAGAMPVCKSWHAGENPLTH